MSNPTKIKKKKHSNMKKYLLIKINRQLRCSRTDYTNYTDFDTDDFLLLHGLAADVARFTRL